MKITDNLLDDSTFKKIQTEIIGSNFPWYFNNCKISESNNLCSIENLNYQFTHAFYGKNKIPSSSFHIIYPIIEKLNIIELIRVKANMTLFWINNSENYGYHVDSDIGCKVAIFYINTNNGFTLFKNQTKVKSVENRLLTFKNNYENLHTGTSCSDQKFRIVLNINYK